MDTDQNEESEMAVHSGEGLIVPCYDKIWVAAYTEVLSRWRRFWWWLLNPVDFVEVDIEYKLDEVSTRRLTLEFGYRDLPGGKSFGPVKWDKVKSIKTFSKVDGLKVVYKLDYRMDANEES